MKQSACQLSDNISDVYKAFLPDFFRKSFPCEDVVDCDNCIMISKDRQDLGDGLSGFLFNYSTFHPVVKCCTYQPNLPNFLVGAILSAKDPDLFEGKKRVKEKIFQGEGVEPQGIQALENKGQADRHIIASDSDSDIEAGCPYFNLEHKKCSIWSCRPANCSTYFCKSVEGVVGRVFWDAMNFYLSNVENQLSHYILHHLGLSAQSEKWLNDKAGFYVETYNYIKEMKNSDFDEMCGPDLDFVFENLQEKYAEAIRSDVPEKLVANPDLTHEELDKEQYLYDTGFGRCIVSPQLHSLLPYFDGAKYNSHVLEQIVEEMGVRVSVDFLLRLYKNKILVAV